MSGSFYPEVAALFCLQTGHLRGTAVPILRRRVSAGRLWYTCDSYSAPDLAVAGTVIRGF